MTVWLNCAWEVKKRTKGHFEKLNNMTTMIYSQVKSDRMNQGVWAVTYKLYI